MTAPFHSRLWRALAWGVSRYRMGRNKPHGVRYTRKTALMIALEGAHMIAFPGQPLRLRWLNAAWWLVVIGERRRLKREARP